MGVFNCFYNTFASEKNSFCVRQGSPLNIFLNNMYKASNEMNYC